MHTTTKIDIKKVTKVKKGPLQNYLCHILCIILIIKVRYKTCNSIYGY